MPYLSVIIPALNEAQRLPPTLERLCAYLESQGFSWEILVVSNGSTDGTESAVRQFALDHPAVRLLTLPYRGKGVAVRTGALASRGEIIFLCDADLSMPPACLESFLDMPAGVDIVVGSREAHGSRRFNEPWHRHVMGRVFNRIVQMLAVPGIEDTQCGFKAFRRGPGLRLFQMQTVQGLGFDVELLFLARKFGFRIYELGIPWYFDADTRVRPGLDTVNMVRDVLRVRWQDLRGQYNAERLRSVT